MISEEIISSVKDPHIIKFVQREVVRLASFFAKTEDQLKPLWTIIRNIASFICEYLEEDSIRVNSVRLQSVKLSSRSRVKKFLFLIDQQGDTFTPPFPALNCEREGFFNDDPQSSYLFPPKQEHVIWFTENISYIIHYLSHQAMHCGWDWDRFVGKFYDNLLSQNPLIKQVLDEAKALSRKRWVKNADLINYIRKNWKHIKTSSFQEAPDVGPITGQIYNNQETWALIIDDDYGWEITFGTSQEEMQDKMYEVFY